jgi:hypothetical protein
MPLPTEGTDEELRDAFLRELGDKLQNENAIHDSKYMLEAELRKFLEGRDEITEAELSLFAARDFPYDWDDDGILYLDAGGLTYVIDTGFLPTDDVTEDSGVIFRRRAGPCAPAKVSLHDDDDDHASD